MREKLKDLCLLMSILILVLPVEAAPGELFEFGNYTEGSGLNKIENASRNYFDSDSGLICIAAGKTSDNEEIISADDLVEDITFLTDSPESELSPVWTANGEYLLYTIEGNESDNFESYRMKANGSEMERTGIGEGNLTGFSDLSLDGRDLVLIKSIDSQLDLYLANLENGTVTPVTNDSQVSEGWGSWCRLGKKITYTQESAGIPAQLWIVDRDGSNKTRLGISENVGTGKDWCPLGLRVIYSAKDSQGKDDLWVIDYHGTNQTQLTNTSYNEWNPSFSPDGKWIAYVSDEGGSPDIWLRDVEGNYRARLTNNTGRYDSIPRWSPDGSKIVFEGYNPGNNSISDLITTETINDSSGSGSNINGSVINGSVADGANSSDIALINGSNAALTNSPDASIINEPDTSSAISSDIVPVNGSDNSPTDNPDSGSLSDSDAGNAGDSEIVVIKLLSEPYVFPYPKITGVKVDPSEGLSQERNVTISITVMNEGGNASAGNISVSFPGKERIERIEGTGNSAVVHPEGSPIQGKEREITAQYPLAELAEYEWGAGQEEILNVTVIPNNETEEISFFVRAGLLDDSIETYRRDPLLSGDEDQQGFNVYRYSLKVA